jgi:hypothetical protein
MPCHTSVATPPDRKDGPSDFVRRAGGRRLSYSGDRTRTCDPLINSQLLYQLSYAGSLVAPEMWAAINKLSPNNGVNH